MRDKQKPCPACGASIESWLLACKPCFLRAPPHLRDAHHTEWQYCHSQKIKHTDKLIALRAQIIAAIPKREHA